MTAYRPIDSKREEFRKYLERAGVMDALTKALVLLYEEPDKPEDALEFIRVNLGDRRPAIQEVESLKQELEAAQTKLQQLMLENARLKGESVGGEEEGGTETLEGVPSAFTAGTTTSEIADGGGGMATAPSTATTQ